MIPASEALERLREGNRRFVSEGSNNDHASGGARRREIADNQTPFAIVLGCSDSRVPAEIVFDQGLGDLFVIRVAGNIVAPSQVGSVEFAADRYGVRLVVVLGHSNCGAILATLEELGRPSQDQSKNLRSIVALIAPQPVCPSTTTSRVLNCSAANSTLPICDGATMLPATRMTNRSPSPWSKTISAGTRESEQPRIMANGSWPAATSARRASPASES